MYERLTAQLRRIAESEHFISYKGDKAKIAEAARVIEKHLAHRVAPPKVGSPVIFRAQKEGPEHVVRPCSADHRALFLSGYIVLSCAKCTRTMRALTDQENGRAE